MRSGYSRSLHGVLLGLVVSANATAQQPSPLPEEACRTGAAPLANVLVRTDPLVTPLLGTLESYVNQNRGHFTEGGDAIRCAIALSYALKMQAIRDYESALEAHQELAATLNAMGIGAEFPSPLNSVQASFLLAQKLDRLVRVLPPAANGDYGPLRTPDEFERMRMMAAEQVHAVFEMDPELAGMVRSVLEKGALLQYEEYLRLATSLLPVPAFPWPPPPRHLHMRRSPEDG